MSSNRMKSNGAKLCRLIIDQGTETMRKYFDSVHSPANLPAVLNANRTMLDGLCGTVINWQQMDLLFPSSGVTKSSDYDITLLFILIRNICGVRPPRTTGWNAKPSPSDNSTGANLVRIKYYRNELHHKKNTEVSDTDFNIYWSEIQGALVGLGASIADIAKLKMSPLDEDLYISLLNEWYENDHKTEVLATKILGKTETIEKNVKKMASDLNECREKDGRIATTILEKIETVEHLGNKILEKTETVEEGVKKIASDVNECREKDGRIERLGNKILEKTETVEEDVKKIASDLNQRREKDGRIEHLGNKIFEKTETVEEDVKKLARDLNECRQKDGKIERLATKILGKIESVEHLGNKILEKIKTAGGIIVITILFIIAAICLVTLVLHLLPRFKFVLTHYFGIKVHYSDRQNFSNPRFVGREWLFRKLEKTLNKSYVRGVQLAIDPGWGKSEIMKRLIYTSNSSAVIHENIIGYHFCKFNDPATRYGEKFVKDLVKLIAKKIDEFQKIIDNDQLIKDELQFNCKKNPLECFQKAIVEPLQGVNATGRNNSFILIDALDECWEKEEGHNSIIVNILSSSDHVPELPTWVKLIVTSRNQAQATRELSNIGGFSTLEINVTDPCNLQDLRNYAKQTLQFFYSKVPSMEEKLPLNRSIDLAVEFSNGNFLFLDRIIKFWRIFPGQMSPEHIPKNVGDIYKYLFAARFKEADLADFQPLLEVLLASNSPLTVSELDKILNYHYKSYDTRSTVVKLSEYFKSDIDHGPLEFHHQLFAEWLSKQTHRSNGVVIQISKGHQYIVDYLFNFYSERETDLTYHELKELCIHILHGDKASVSNRRKLSSLKVFEVKEKFTIRTILHDLASRNDSTGLIDVLIKQFKSVDILDWHRWTPAMYAVKAGNYKNLKLFIDNGANVSLIFSFGTKFLGCYRSDFMDPMTYFALYMHRHTLSVIAIYKGYTRIAELLITRGAKIEQSDVCGYNALHLAVLMGRFEIVQLYMKKTQPDLVSLHHAAASNQTKIVQLLLKTGIRDECLPCKPRDYSSCTMNVNQFHDCFCETALHAAVSRNNLKMAELILQYGNASVNCKHGSGLTPLMEAISQNNTQMVEILLSAGADINAQCESSISDLVYDCIYDEKEFVYSSYCNRLVCNESGLIDFVFAHGFWETMIPFISNRKLKASLNSLRRSPTTTAAIYDQIDFINATYGKKLNSLPNIGTMIHYVAVCNSVEILKHLLNNSDDLSKFTAVYNDGKTLLHFATLGSSKPKTEKYATKSCAFSACVCPNMESFDITEEKRLETIRLLLKVLASVINKQDTYGRTALHYAAVQGLSKLVEYLVNEGADWSIEDQRGDTALEYALREKPDVDLRFLPCRLTSDQMFRVCQSTPFDELANYLLQNATIKTCDTRAMSLLRGLLRHKLSLSLYELFKSGFDVNCAREQFREYLLYATYSLHFPWSWYVLKVFKVFQFNIKVACDAPFKESELHLIAHLIKFWYPSRNFSQLTVPFQLERIIATHPKGVEILNECYDKEGYLPIHRAVQGRNLHAVSWFIEIGVDLSLKTKSNITSLVLAGLCTDIFDLQCIIDPLCNRNCVFNKLLEKLKEKNHTDFQCNTERIDLSPLHIMGMRGMAMLEMVHRILPTIPLNCTNSHGIHPIYLVYLYYATADVHNSKDYHIEAFRKLRRSHDIEFTKYPEREAEYHLIYNQFYYTPQDDLRNMVDHEGLFECPGINEMLPNQREIKEYKLKACVARCWPSAFEASREFFSNFRYLRIPNNFSNPFTDKFTDISHHMAELRFHLVKMFSVNSFHYIFISEKELWRKVTKAHSCARTCSCFEIMELLQKTFTSKPRVFRYVGKFVAQRMGWSDTSIYGDVRYRWPFSFLLKKALTTDKAYKYLKILTPDFNPNKEAIGRITYILN